MTKHMKENLMKLNKEQLIYLIEQYHHTDVLIGETLVDQSKGNITNEKCIEKIRKYSSENYISLNDEHLGDYIDIKLGKITKEEYRKIVLGEKWRELKKDCWVRMRKKLRDSTEKENIWGMSEI